jgi:hypothetical protein
VFESQGCEYIYKFKIVLWHVLSQPITLCSVDRLLGNKVVCSMSHSDIYYSCGRGVSEWRTSVVSDKTVHCNWLHCSSGFDCCYSGRLYHLQDSKESFLPS